MNRLSDRGKSEEKERAKKIKGENDRRDREGVLFPSLRSAHPRRPRSSLLERRDFHGESLQQERESPWAFTLTERVPEAFEIKRSDWPEKFAGSPRMRSARSAH